MSKVIVTISTLFIDGVKHKRGDIVDVENPNIFSTRVAPYVEPPKAKKSVAKRGIVKKVVKDED